MPLPHVRKPAGEHRDHVAHAWLSAESYELLELEAARLAIHPDRLAAALLIIVLRDSLVEAVLDR